MARGIANRFGTQPAPVVTTQSRGGGGGANRSRSPNRGGGGGNKKLPNTGLYAGRQGEALANQDPEKFIRSILGHAGVSDFSGTPYGEWANIQLPQNLLEQYTLAQDLKQTTSPVDWAKNTYGAGFMGKKGKNFQAGSLSSATAPLAEQYVDHRSNTMPLSYLREKGVAGGAISPVAGGGNQDFEDYWMRTFTPGMQGQLEAKQAATGNYKLSLDDFVAGRDLTDEARTAYAFRPNSRRLPGPLNLSGRYSWWS